MGIEARACRPPYVALWYGLTMNNASPVMMQDRFSLLVFDWDGTLMDSQERIVACIEAAAEDLGAEVRDRRAISNIIGLGLRQAVDTLYPGSSTTFHAALAERYRHHYLYANNTPTPMFRGAREMLESLRDRGYALAVATGKSRAGLDQVLHETKCEALFDVTRCADETRSKPHPQMLHEIMQETEVQPNQTLMIGDTDYDIQMAHSAGAAALAVCYGAQERGRLLRSRPLDCAESIDGLRDWLGI